MKCQHRLLQAWLNSFYLIKKTPAKNHSITRWKGHRIGIYRTARAVAIEDPNYEVRFGDSGLANTRRFEFIGKDGKWHGWILLNAKKEPLIWATTQYKYMFGQMKRFGNLRVPNWAVTGEGVVTYEMFSVKGSDKTPDPSLFVPPNDAETKENKPG